MSVRPTAAADTEPDPVHPPGLLAVLGGIPPYTVNEGDINPQNAPSESESFILGPKPQIYADSHRFTL